MQNEVYLQHVLIAFTSDVPKYSAKYFYGTTELSSFDFIRAVTRYIMGMWSKLAQNAEGTLGLCEGLPGFVYLVGKSALIMLLTVNGKADDFVFSPAKLFIFSTHLERQCLRKPNWNICKVSRSPRTVRTCKQLNQTSYLDIR